MQRQQKREAQRWNVRVCNQQSAGRNIEWGHVNQDARPFFILPSRFLQKAQKEEKLMGGAVSCFSSFSAESKEEQRLDSNPKSKEERAPRQECQQHQQHQQHQQPPSVLEEALVTLL